MQLRPKYANFLAVASAFAVSTAALAALAVQIDDSVPTTNERTTAGVFLSSPNLIIDDYSLERIAQGTDPLENPSGPITMFGYLADGTKTEPDENTYLTLDANPGGPTAGYDYGRRFLIQGHENAGGLAYVTRINLDITDPAHRITLLTPVDPASGQTGLSSIDGSVWDPFTRRLLFTQENAATRGVIEVTPGWPATVRTFEGIIGTGGFEGIHPDDKGDLLIIEDAGGVGVNVIPFNAASPKAAKQPNSFVYKFHPYDATDLSAGGTLYALQVWMSGSPITFHAGDPVGDTFSPAQLQLHTPGTSWPVLWVRVHDTASDGTAAFDANAAAKAAGATPFKRPENAQFLPGSDFSTFFFCPTGDTNADSGNQPALAARGAWGSIFRVDLRGRGPVGQLSIVVLGDAEHSSFDNLTFADNRTLLATEDRGDGLHDQLNRLDSVWAFDVRGGSLNPRRLIALGRDDVATAGDIGGCECDNEPTGLLVSDGAASIAGLIGKPVQTQQTRWFVTQQHGRNQVWEFKFVEERGR